MLSIIFASIAIEKFGFTMDIFEFINLLDKLNLVEQLAGLHLITD